MYAKYVTASDTPDTNLGMVPNDEAFSVGNLAMMFWESNNKCLMMFWQSNDKCLMMFWQSNNKCLSDRIPNSCLISGVLGVRGVSHRS